MLAPESSAHTAVYCLMGLQVPVTLFGVSQCMHAKRIEEVHWQVLPHSGVVRNVV
jgi:hypothetical protein